MGSSDPTRTALWVVAHPQPDSLNAHLRDVGTTTLREDGWRVVESDLYAMAWDPVLVDPGGTDVEQEQDKLRAAGLLVLQFPLRSRW
jgi:NAD(P)H dehydrogenase (quinone)